jgi:ribonuclease HI
MLGQMVMKPPRGGMQVVVYTDGSFCRKSGAAGWAFLLRHPLLAGEVEASGSCYTKDNNEPE